jgi:hypothetical protein
LLQTLKDGKVTVTTSEPERLSLKGLPLTITLELEVKDPNKIGPWCEGIRHAGYRYSEEISEWFSTAIEKPVYGVYCGYNPTSVKKMYAPGKTYES